ncbi:MAG TPA: CinA family protein [Caulobacteraceae bacterium]
MTETLSPALPPDTEALIHQVLEQACARELKLATAESCTGGLVASVLTDVDGCAHVFDRGFVVYSNEAKRDLLGVPAKLLADPGPVSEAVARAMADGALDRSGAHISVAVTGFTGPAGPGKTPGLVHFALASRDRRTLHRVEHFGEVDRGAGRLASLRTALTLLQAAIADIGAS